MSDETRTLILEPRQHEHLGQLHCGVTYDGFIVVAGEPRNIDDGEEIAIQRVPVRVKRRGSKYTFTRVA